MSIKLHRLLVPINEVIVKKLTGLDAYRLQTGAVAYLEAGSAATADAELIPTLLRINSHELRLDENDIVNENILYEWAKGQVVNVIEQNEALSNAVVEPATGDYAVVLDNDGLDEHGIVKVLDIIEQDVKVSTCEGIAYYKLGQLAKVESIAGGVALVDAADPSRPVIKAA